MMLSVLSLFAPGANYYLVKALGDDGSGFSSDVAVGIEACVAYGANIISLSFEVSSGYDLRSFSKSI